MNKTTLTALVLAIGVIFYAYWGIWNIFFQQDEWLGLGGAIARSEVGGLSEVFRNIFGGDAVRFLPFTSLLSYVVFSTIKTNFALYGVLALGLLLANVIFSYLAIKRITGYWQFGFLVSLLFITNNLFYQSAAWIGTLVSSQFALLFFLLSIYLLSRYLETKRLITLLFSTVFILICLLFKESALFYLPTYLFLIWLPLGNNKKNVRVNKFKTSLILTIPIIIILLLRLIFSNGSISDFSPASVGGSEEASVSIDQKITYNAFLVPARSLFHVFINQRQIYEWVYQANKTHYSGQTNGFVVESIIADSLSLLISFYILLFILLALLIADRWHKKLIILSLFTFFASTMPFIIFKNDAAILEPRYFLFPALWAGLLLVSVFDSFFSRLGFLRWFLMFIVISCMIFQNSLGVRELLEGEVYIGKFRLEILNTISEVKPHLASDNVFYFYTENNGFYEFQSGFGQTLAVWLYDSGKIPREALTDNDFWNGYEGIKSFDKGKYGYFMTYQKLVNGLKMNPDIDLTSVHAYYWDLQKHTVKNVSVEIREKLMIDLK